MAKLYEIDNAIMECVDMETGEIIDSDRLNELMMERNEKIEAVALWIKNLESDAAAYKAEMDAFKKRMERAQNKAEQLKKWLAFACDGQAFASGKCEVTFRKSEKVEIADKTAVPESFMRTKVTTTSEPDKIAIKAAIKNGEAVDGCVLVNNITTTIK